MNFTFRALDNRMSHVVTGGRKGVVPHRGLKEVCEERISWEGAYRAFQQAVEFVQQEEKGGDADMLFCLGKACEKLGDRQWALDAFLQARAANPSRE